MRERCKLLDVCNIQYGCPFESSLFSLSKEEGMPLIRIRDVKSGHTETYYTGAYTSEYVIHKGDYLIGMDGEFNIAKWRSEDALLNQRVCKVESKSSQVSIDYIYRFLTKELKKIEDETPYVTVKHLSAKRLNQVIIPLPPLPEQERIVAELDCLSSIIEKQKGQLNELDNLAQSIFYTTFGDPVSNNFGWNVKKLGDICTIERGGSPRPITDYITDAEDGVNWIKIGDASEGSMYINSVKDKIKPEGVKKSRKVYKGDFILSNSMSFGKPYILGVDGCIHDGWLVIRDNDNVFNKCYLYYYLSSDALYGEFKSLAVGGVVNNLNSNLVRGVKVCIPDLSLQQEFASKIEVIEKQKELIKQSLAETETLFNSRMDYYFN